MWLAVLRSGVHPSVVGVAMGLLVNAYAPRRYDIARVQVAGRSFLVDPTPDRAAAAQAAVTEAVSPNERLQLRIQPWSSYVIVPLFVLANAGRGADGGDAARGRRRRRSPGASWPGSWWASRSA